MSTKLADIPESSRRIIAIGKQPEEKGIGFGVTDALAVGVGFLNPLAWAYVIGKKAVEASTATGAPPPGVLFHSLSDIDGRTHFPPGHPVENGVYVANPVRPQRYFTMAEFHSRALREKIAELFRLLAGLRADTVIIDVHKETTTKGSIDIGATIPADVPVKVGVAGSEANKNSASIRYEAKFSGRGAPAIPTDLGWFDHEPEWQSVARTRLADGLSDFCLSLRYVDDCGVTGSLKVKLEDFGFKVGGKFTEFQSETWTVTGRFQKKPMFGWS